MLKYIITGTGRSGTGYIARLLTKNGVKCGHERVFTVHGPNMNRINKYEADCGWLAAPYLPLWHDKVHRIVHQVRYPPHVLRSWFFDFGSMFSLNRPHRPNAFTKYLLQHYPEIKSEAKTVDQALLYYLMCNRRCERYANFFFRVEDCPLELLCFVHASTVTKQVSRKANTRDKKQYTEEDALDAIKGSKYRFEFMDMFERYYGAVQDLPRLDCRHAAADPATEG